MCPCACVCIHMQHPHRRLAACVCLHRCERRGHKEAFCCFLCLRSLLLCWATFTAAHSQLPFFGWLVACPTHPSSFFFFFMYFFVNPWWIQTCHSGVARALWKPAAPAGRATKEGNNFSVNKESHSHLKIAEPLTRQESFESGLDAPAANGLYSLHYTDIIDPCKK